MPAQKMIELQYKFNPYKISFNNSSPIHTSHTTQYGHIIPKRMRCTPYKMRYKTDRK